MLEFDSKENLDTYLNENKITLALFYASWCPYCQSFLPTFNKETKAFGSAVHVLLDDYDNRMWDDFDIGAVPTVILFEDGKVCSRLDGRFGIGLTEKQLVIWLQNLNI